jgi:hypothetical protein
VACRLVACLLHYGAPKRARDTSGPARYGANMATTWQPTTLVQCISIKPWLVFPGCDEPGGCHDLTLGKIYEMVGVEADGAFYRIIDDSGEDFLYPASHFRVV